MRVVFLETLLCLAIGILLVFVFDSPGFLCFVAYVGFRGTLCDSRFVRYCGVSAIAIAALLYPTFSDTLVLRNAMRRMQASNDLAIASEAVEAYFADHGCWPWRSEEGKNLSWRVKILPYVGMRELYEELDLTEPWDSETNRPLLISVKNPIPQASYGSEMFCIRDSGESTTRTPYVILFEMKATNTHWAAIEKDPTSQTFLEECAPSIHTTQCAYCTLSGWYTGCFIVLSDFKMRFAGNRLSLPQWEQLLTPEKRQELEVDSLLIGKRDESSFSRYDKLAGLCTLFVFGALHAGWFLAPRLSKKFPAESKETRV